MNRRRRRGADALRRRSHVQARARLLITERARLRATAALPARPVQPDTRTSRVPAAAASAAETLLETDSCIKAAFRPGKAATPAPAA